MGPDVGSSFSVDRVAGAALLGTVGSLQPNIGRGKLPENQLLISSLAVSGGRRDARAPPLTSVDHPYQAVLSSLSLLYADDWRD